VENSKECPDCSKQLLAIARFCDSCGARQSEISQDNVSAQSVTAGESLKQETKSRQQTIAPYSSRYSDELVVKLSDLGTAPEAQVASGTLFFGERTEYGRVHIYAKDRVLFGRDSEQSDVVLWVPKNSSRLEHDEEKTGAISGKHFEIGLGKNCIELSDLSRFGTSLNGIKLTRDLPTPIPIDRVSELEVVDFLSLRLTPIARIDSDGSEKTYSALGSSGEKHSGTPTIGVKGLIIEHLSPLEKHECYVILYDWVGLGESFSSDGKSRGIGGGAIRLVGRGNRLWLHNHGYDGAIQLGRTTLKPGEVSPLGYGIDVSIGKETGTFSQVSQVKKS
jgi:hypothetical protein